MNILLVAAGIGALVAIAGGFAGVPALIKVGGAAMMISLLLLPWLREREPLPPRDRAERRTRHGALDADLEDLSRDQLIEEVRRLRNGIRAHRDSSGHELCWHHPNLWNLLPEERDRLPVVPEWPEFLRGCVRYRQSLDDQLPDAPRTDRPYPGR